MKPNRLQQPRTRHVDFNKTHVHVVHQLVLQTSPQQTYRWYTNQCNTIINIYESVHVHLDVDAKTHRPQNINANAKNTRSNVTETCLLHDEDSWFVWQWMQPAHIQQKFLSYKSHPKQMRGEWMTLSQHCAASSVTSIRFPGIWKRKQAHKAVKDHGYVDLKS